MRIRMLRFLRKLRHTIEHHMPEAVVRRDGWGCRAIALPGRRIWLVPTDIAEQQAMDAFVFCQVVIGQCGVSFPSEKAVGFSPVRNWPVIARVLLFHCIRA
jgi:hypothetical protein